MYYVPQNRLTSAAIISLHEGPTQEQLTKLASSRAKWQSRNQALIGAKVNATARAQERRRQRMKRQAWLRARQLNMVRAKSLSCAPKCPRPKPSPVLDRHGRRDRWLINFDCVFPAVPPRYERAPTDAKEGVCPPAPFFREDSWGLAERAERKPQIAQGKCQIEDNETGSTTEYGFALEVDFSGVEQVWNVCWTLLPLATTLLCPPLTPAISLMSYVFSSPAEQVSQALVAGVPAFTGFSIGLLFGLPPGAVFTPYVDFLIDAAAARLVEDSFLSNAPVSKTF